MTSPPCTPTQTKAGPKLWILTCPRSRTSTRVSTAPQVILETKAVKSTSSHILACALHRSDPAVWRRGNARAVTGTKRFDRSPIGSPRIQETRLTTAKERSNKK